MQTKTDSIGSAGSSLIDAGIAHWKSLASGGAVPQRADFDPMQIPRLLPYAILLEINETPPDFSFRVAGEHIIENFGSSPIRRTLSDLIAEHPSIAGFADNFRACIDQRKPIQVADRFTGADRQEKRTNGVILPLADHAGRVSHLLIFALYLNSLGEPIEA